MRTSRCRLAILTRLPVQNRISILPVMVESDSLGLVNGQHCLELLFPQEPRPTLRWFLGLKAKGLIPYRKIGGSIFYDPAEVRRAIDRLCKVEAGQ
jgi:hypothetical protein